MTRRLIVAAALALLGLTSGRAYAASSATLNIDITVNAAAAVSIDSLGVSSTPFVTWSGTTRIYTSGDNANGIAYTSATVTNPGSLTERWYLSTLATTIDQSGGGGATWANVVSTLTADVNSDQFALQAVFASSATTGGSAGAGNCPDNTHHIWLSTATNVTTAAPATGDTGNAYGSKGGGTNFDINTYAADPAGNPCPDTGCSSNHYKMFSNSALPAGSGTRALCWRLILPNSSSAATNQIIPLIVTAQQN